jgi:autophagy-related protein 9
MMASNILSRFLPSASDEGGEDPGAPRRIDDIEAMAADDLASEPQFEDQDLEDLLAEGMEDDIRIPKGSDTSDARSRSRPRRTQIRFPPSSTRGRGHAVTDEDDDVPESLLLERKPERRRRRRSQGSRNIDDGPIPVVGLETRRTRLQWETTQAEQPLHDDFHPVRPSNYTAPRGAMYQSVMNNPKEQALWMWANVDNLDQFLSFVYYYYESHGIWSIILKRSISVLTALFVYGLSTFMFFCIDYSKLPTSTKLEQVRVPKCTTNLPGYWNLFTFGFISSTAYMTFRFVQDLPRLWDMHNFYHHLLEIPDTDIQNVSWPDVIAKLMELRDSNPNTAANLSTTHQKFLRTQSKQRMDAHDIANRLMRRENYWIALINKDILDCSLNIPFIGKKAFYTRSLEWNIAVCLMDFIFDENGQVRTQFRTTKRRKELVQVLQKRFLLAAMVNIIISVPMALWAIAIRFLRSFTEYQKNPAELSTKKFSLYAEWKIRDFNEVSHLFHRRKRMSYPFANRYLDQFPKDKLSQVMRFAAFIPGALAAVLGVVTLWDPDLFLGFEIGGKTALFWLGIFGTLFVTFRSAAADEEDDLWDPEIAMNAVIAHTHYCPDSWKDRLYSDEVRKEFSSMYKLEALLFLEDLAGVIITPLVLFWCLPNCAEQLIDFFREFTVHVDGLGTVCSYAVFDFKNGGKAAARPGHNGPGDLREGYYGDKANKLMESYMSFIDHYGPNPKRGLHSRKRPFHPPPTFPGIMGGSPSAMNDHSGSQRAHQSGLRQSMQHTPNIAPAPGHVSPMHSILLDPHHQPRAAPAQPQVRSSKVALSRHHILEDDPLEAEEETDGVGPSRPNIPRTSSNLLDEDSQLEESWIFKADDKGEGEASAEPKVGVLGMLNEFTRPKTEARGGRI